MQATFLSAEDTRNGFKSFACQKTRALSCRWCVLSRVCGRKVRGRRANRQFMRCVHGRVACCIHEWRARVVVCVRWGERGPLSVDWGGCSVDSCRCKAPSRMVMIRVVHACWPIHVDTSIRNQRRTIRRSRGVIRHTFAWFGFSSFTRAIDE